METEDRVKLPDVFFSFFFCGIRRRETPGEFFNPYVTLPCNDSSAFEGLEKRLFSSKLGENVSMTSYDLFRDPQKKISPSQWIGYVFCGEEICER